MKIRDNWIFTGCLRRLLWNLKTLSKKELYCERADKRSAPLTRLLFSKLAPKGCFPIFQSTQQDSSVVLHLKSFCLQHFSQEKLLLHTFFCFVLLLFTAWYKFDLGFLFVSKCKSKGFSPLGILHLSNELRISRNKDFSHLLPCTPNGNTLTRLIREKNPTQ